VRQVRSVVFGLENLAAGLRALDKYRIHIADVARDFARLPRSGFQRFAERR
jgi:hypothetical protein